ncbi:MAG: FliM/FliN family flagellar motor switch protein [Deltaproteobacteria bacterium]|nr:FliM/FliN family flagellar motor switch protein [Deltaproteobacteria bacterium]
MSAALDEDEAAALRESASKQAASTRTVAPFELLNAEARVRSKLSLVDEASEAFAQRLGAMLTRARKRSTKIVGEPSTMIASAERDARLNAEGVLCALTSEASNGATGAALLHIAAPLLLEVVDRRFGGRGEAAAASGRQRSPLELQVAADLCELLLTEINAVRANLWPTLRYRTILPKLEQAAALMGRAALLALAWGEQSDPRQPSLTLLLPGAAVEAREHGRSPPPSEAWKREFSLRVVDANVDLVAELGAATLTIEELLALSPGQVFRLDRAAHDELDVRVFGEPVFCGTPSAESSHLVLTFDRWRDR